MSRYSGVRRYDAVGVSAASVREKYTVVLRQRQHLNHASQCGIAILLGSGTGSPMQGSIAIVKW
jgi:hypothetical protein